MRSPDLVGRIDILRAIFLAVYGLVAMPVVFLGWIALSDYDFRGCFSVEANQCSDARAVMGLAVGYILMGPVVWVFLKYLRKRASVRKGFVNA